ncbi:MAG: hypothetical protein LW688_12565, partial [Cryomorphaceae bacterium]|nr:hypothetical protein [Cryomorphaceae bacterium]
TFPVCAKATALIIATTATVKTVLIADVFIFFVFVSETKVRPYRYLIPIYNSIQMKFTLSSVSAFAEYV